MTAARPLSSGLCSVTFRQLDPVQVVSVAAAAGLEGIEWGADVHVPAGDLKAAAAATRATNDAGLRVASYGSYLFADEASRAAIGPVLDTAEALGTDLIRVWCPFGVGPAAARPDRDAVADVLAEWATAAVGRGLTLYLEFHGGTLTASAASTVALLAQVGATNVATAWQPPYWATRSPAADDGADLAVLAPWLAHVHVYEWAADLTRLPLAAGVDHWPAALRAAAEGRADLDRFALIEFVPDDDPALLAAEAATLRGWLAR